MAEVAGGLTRADAVEYDVECAGTCFSGVEQLDGAGRKIAWVGVELLAFGLACCIDALELLVAHINLTAHFEDLWRVVECHW